MAIVKLANAGDSLTFRVKSAETVAGKFGAQVKFTAENGDCLFISEDTAGRQLGRIPLDTMECAGETLTFSRTENPKGGAPYWNITVADVIDSAPAPSDNDAPESVTSESISDKSVALLTAKVAPKAEQKMAVARGYLDLLAWVKTQEPTNKMTDEACQAAAATIYIAWKNAGLNE